jgi:hypothetical protein
VPVNSGASCNPSSCVLQRNVRNASSTLAETNSIISFFAGMLYFNVGKVKGKCVGVGVRHHFKVLCFELFVVKDSALFYPLCLLFPTQIG